MWCWNTSQSLIYVSSTNIHVCRWLPSYRKIKFRLMLNTRYVPCKSLGSCRIHTGSYQSMLQFPSSLDRQAFLSTFKTKVQGTKEGEGWGIACLGSYSRHKLRCHLGDSNQMTQDMLSMVGNKMDLNYTARLPPSLVSFSNVLITK